MKDFTRRAVAYVAALLSGARASSLYDYGSGSYYHFSGSIQGGNLSLYDFDQKCHITGSGSQNNFALYHFGSRSHLSLTLQGNGQFTGYDYDTHSHFSGNVQGGSISLYDHSTGTWHNFST